MPLGYQFSKDPEMAPVPTLAPDDGGDGGMGAGMGKLGQIAGAQMRARDDAAAALSQSQGQGAVSNAEADRVSALYAAPKAMGPVIPSAQGRAPTEAEMTGAEGGPSAMSWAMMQDREGPQPDWNAADQTAGQQLADRPRDAVAAQAPDGLTRSAEYSRYAQLSGQGAQPALPRGGAALGYDAAQLRPRTYGGPRPFGY